MKEQVFTLNISHEELRYLRKVLEANRFYGSKEAWKLASAEGTTRGVRNIKIADSLLENVWRLDNATKRSTRKGRTNPALGPR